MIGMMTNTDNRSMRVHESNTLGMWIGNNRGTAREFRALGLGRNGVEFRVWGVPSSRPLAEQKLFAQRVDSKTAPVYTVVISK